MGQTNDLKTQRLHPGIKTTRAICSKSFLVRLMSVNSEAKMELTVASLYCPPKIANSQAGWT